jgi:hypothetical protein
MAILGLASVSSAALFVENFDADHTANWQVNNGPSDGTAQFFFDYSTLGIPTAPHSGGSTRGLRMMANQSNGIFSGLSTSPIGQSFSGNYTLAADVWMNFNGPAPAGGSGSTQIGGLGIGTSGTVANWPGFADGVYFEASGDGNSSADYRAYSPAAVASYQDTSGVYAAGSAAGSRNSSNAYYSGFGNVGAPAAQIALFPNQTGTVQAGAQAWKWHRYEIVKVGNSIKWRVDGLLIATVDGSTFSLGGGNIMLNHSDINATSSTDANDFLICTIFDNVVVTSSVPEPTTLAVLGVGAFALLRRKRKNA